jgi:hypothetical protein
MQTVLKVAQIAGALMMAMGVTSCVDADGPGRDSAWWWIAGGAVYGAARLAAWFRT